MPSKLKSETARINGAKSRGPKSPATRQKSSANSLQHGLTAANTLVLACEVPEEFKKFLDEYMAVHQPVNAAECDLVDQMAAARWRVPPSRSDRSRHHRLRDGQQQIRGPEKIPAGRYRHPP